MITVRRKLGFCEALRALSDSEVIPPGTAGAIQNELHDLTVLGAPDSVLGIVRRTSVAVLRLEWAMHRADASAVEKIRVELSELRADWLNQTEDGVFNRFTSFPEPVEWQARGAADDHLLTDGGANVRILSLR